MKTVGNYQSYLAEKIVLAVVPAVNVVAAMSDEQSPTPRRIATLACDIAQAMVNELTERGWLWEKAEEAAP